jgi:uncharacterized membrane protein
MHRAFWFVDSVAKLAVAALCVVALAAGVPARAADAPAATPHVKGLFLTTDYPSLAARVGESTTVKLKLQNYDLPPQRIALTIDDVPTGWKAAILGGSMPVTAAMPGSNENVPLSLRVDIPADAAAGTRRVILHARGADGVADLPIDFTIGQDLPAQLSIKAKLPSLNGTATTSFEYQFTVKNDSDKDLLVKLAAQAPRGFQTSFMEAYGTQELSSVPIEAGKDKDLKVKVTPPGNVTAGDYSVVVAAAAEGAKAESQLAMTITGQPKLRVSGENDRLSAQAEAGNSSPINLIVTNTGSAPAEDIELSSSPPSDWKVVFEPQKIDALQPNEKKTVEALLTPSSKAVAGDYMTTFRASGKGDSTSADFRITVATSTLWGVAGIGIIAISLLVAVGAVARFGRR